METPGAPVKSSAPPAAAEPCTRILSLDAVRGVALLGIFCVNSTFFSLPFGDLFAKAPPENASTIDRAAWYFVHVCCEGKFYPLFSMLFGFGLTLQLTRLIRAGRPFVGVGVRRLLFLTLVGFLHATLLWYGDILFVYGIVGLLCLPLIRLAPRTLLVIGAGLILFSAVAVAGLSAAGFGTHREPPVQTTRIDRASPQTEPQTAQTPYEQLMKGLRTGKVQDPGDPLWTQAEILAYRNGPYWQATVFRVMSWLMCIMVMILGVGWHIWGLFAIGAALSKFDLFASHRRPWRVRFAAVGLIAGLPLVVLSNRLTVLLPGRPGEALAAGLSMFLDPLVSLGYLGAVSLLAEAIPALGRILANVGRMAFTNYLMQTLIATFVMYHWGLAKFDTFSMSQLLLMVALVYLVQVVFSNLWLSVFRFGPLEWIWRSVTYLRIPSMLRRPPDASDGIGSDA